MDGQGQKEANVRNLNLSRRQFLGGTIGGLALANAGTGIMRGASADRPSQEAVKNRDPLLPNRFYMLPLTSVRPKGWLARQLQIQADGLSGHVDEFWSEVGPKSAWLGGTGESWERGPYYIDGFLPLAYLVNDPALIAKARKWMDWTLDHQQESGQIGPLKDEMSSEYQGLKNHPGFIPKDWWPRIPMLKALTQYCEATGDPRVVPVMQKYFAYRLRLLSDLPSAKWAKYRYGDELVSVFWLYNRTGDPSLLELAKGIHAQGFDWNAHFENFRYTFKVAKGEPTMATHGVNNAMALKNSVVYSALSHEDSDRMAIYQALSMLDQYHLLPNGVHSADEHYAGLNPSQGTELCAVAEAMFSLEHLIAILGDPHFADRLEKITFNAWPGTFSADMWAHQYDQQPNQVLSSLEKRDWGTNGPESNLFGLEPNYACCLGNMHQGWPKFTASLWMATPDDGIAAVLYAPCEVRAQVKGGVPVAIVEDTEYPFRGNIRLTVNPESPVEFPLELRIPAWAEATEVSVNGKSLPDVQPGTFHRVQREWRANDVVEVTFPMKVRATRSYHESVALERGPLVFSLKIGEDWKKLRDKVPGTDWDIYAKSPAADWEVHPTTDWNYALVIDPLQAEKSVTVEENPIGDRPFSPESNPVLMRIKARKLPDWSLLDGSAGPLPPSPVTTAEPDEVVTLAPYGCAKLRITAFPWLKA
jgi:DUF1680 family protein